MKKNNLFLFVLFWVVLIVDCAFIYSGHNEYRVYTKILLVPILLVAIYGASRDTKHKRSRVLINLAFFFCFLGDVFLLEESDSSYFSFGLASFLIAHIFFIIFFYRLKPFTDKYRLYIFSCGLLILTYVLFLLFFVWSNVSRQSLEIPIAAYAAVLGFMTLTAAHTLNNKSIKHLASNFFIPGAVFFLLSDSLLAINKFSMPFDFSGIAVMVTYGIAIFLLATGAIRFLVK